MKCLHQSLLLVLSFFALSGCAAQTLRGAVVDKDTEKPVPGVIVYSYWTSYGGFVDSRSACVRIDFATTDQNGRYELPSPYIHSKEMVLRMGVYKAGYEEHMNLDHNGYAIPYKGPEGERWLMMKPFMGTTKGRLEYLQQQSAYKDGCGKDQQKLLPFYKALYQEGRTLSPYEETERKIVRGFLFSIENIELGNNEAHKRQRERWQRGEY